MQPTPVNKNNGQNNMDWDKLIVAGWLLWAISHNSEITPHLKLYTECISPIKQYNKQHIKQKTYNYSNGV